MHLVDALADSGDVVASTWREGDNTVLEDEDVH